MAVPVLTFEPLSAFSPGELADILGRSYAALVEEEPDLWGREREKWADFDRRAFAHPETIGRCVFVSRHGSETVGLGSYDPRPGPDRGIVGQNCVLPDCRGRGFGSRQVLEILKRFVDIGIRAARVTTSGHPFFAPALKMYGGLGFREIRRFAGGPDPRYPLVELERPLRPGSELDR